MGLAGSRVHVSVCQRPFHPLDGEDGLEYGLAVGDGHAEGDGAIPAGHALHFDRLRDPRSRRLREHGSDGRPLAVALGADGADHGVVVLAGEERIQVVRRLVGVHLATEGLVRDDLRIVGDQRLAAVLPTHPIAGLSGVVHEAEEAEDHVQARHPPEPLEDEAGPEHERPAPGAQDLVANDGAAVVVGGGPLEGGLPRLDGEEARHLRSAGRRRPCPEGGHIRPTRGTDGVPAAELEVVGLVRMQALHLVDPSTFCDIALHQAGSQTSSEMVCHSSDGNVADLVFQRRL
mmetsp:Transcript_88768/g.275969  ORF Transcript_88768/g.275969 Transcript_88768/m.275969 type:complete len:289 (-) Transcript_88768:192-1058(-)